MKRILVLGIVLMLSAAAFAQKNITQFMGIPIDGTKSAMIQKLKAKGFKYNATDDVLSGQFNGRNVFLRVVTNNNKVYRIIVSDEVGTTEGEIKIRFNTLINQFENNRKYISFYNFKISSDEDVSYGITVLNKRYEADYYQISDKEKDTTGFSQWFSENLLDVYTSFYNRLPDNLKQKNLSSEEQNSLIESLESELLMNFILQKISHKSVWFMISESYGYYYINIFYDNVLNRANGEDL